MSLISSIRARSTWEPFPKASFFNLPWFLESLHFEKFQMPYYQRTSFCSLTWTNETLSPLVLLFIKPLSCLRPFTGILQVGLRRCWFCITVWVNLEIAYTIGPSLVMDFERGLDRIRDLLGPYLPPTWLHRNANTCCSLLTTISGGSRLLPNMSS